MQIYMSKNKLVYLTKCIIPVALIFFKFFLIFYPREAISASREGLLLWFNNVLPSLLPFMVAVNIMVGLGFVRVLSKAFTPFMKFLFNLPGAGGFVLLTGLTSGYPMGAKTVADLYESGEINKREAQHLLGFCNNAGPLFIVGVVGVGMLGNRHAGYLLWVGHVVTAIVMGVMLRFFNGQADSQSNFYSDSHLMKKRISQVKLNDKNTPTIGKVLGDSVKNSVESITFVGGLIIFFCVVLQAISVVVPTGVLPIFAGVLEITNGAKTAASSAGAAGFAAVAFVIGFGGMSVHAQALHFLSGTDLCVRRYLAAKLLHGFLAASVAVFLWRFVA